MSTIKKLLALVLALTMVLSVSAAAAYSVVPYGDADSINEDCEMAVEMLFNMGIMKGDNLGNFNPEATITRAEVAKMIYVILNYGEDDLAKNYTGAKIFSDVEAGLWYEGYINYAATTKLVQGRPDGTFGPNDPITCAEAAKMLLTAIGYSAEARGYTGAGWDKQVLSDASIIGLLDGYDYNTQTYAPRQWVAVMFKNALTDALTYDTIAPMTFNGLLTGINTGSYDYVTMGEKYFNLKHISSGIVTANEYANLYDDEPISSGRTILDDNGNKLKVSTTLDDLGESREVYYNDETNAVYYFGDTGDNVSFSTGAATEILKKYVDGLSLASNPEYFLNFGDADYVKEGYETHNGEWLKVIDNDGDDKAEYVFVTEFTMAVYDGMDSDEEVIYLSTGLETDEFAVAEDVEEDDVVIYTTIDGVTYVELAPSFIGEASKYTYKNDALTVEGEDYPQSGIDYDEKLDLFALVANAKKDTEYTYYQDFFGNIRLFGVDEADSGEFVLLTDAYYETKRDGKVAAVYAYLDGEIVDIDVKTSTSSTDIEMFIKERTNSNNSWGKLINFEGGTSVARYSITDDVMTLKDAETWSYKTNGDKKQIITQYIDLNNDSVKAGATKYEGTVVDVNETTGVKTNGDNVTVQVNRNTVFYYIDEDDNVKVVTGYKNSYDVNDDIVGIEAMYAVATNVEEDADEDPYWVADVVVIETVTPVFNLKTNDIVLGYDIVNRTVNDYAYMDVVKADASLDGLNVISHNGDDFDTFVKNDELKVLNFFFNTEDEDEDSYLVDLTDYEDNDIYAGTVDRANELYEYVTLVNGTTTELVYTEDTVVYDIDKKTRYNSISTVSAGLKTDKEYIFFAPDGEIVYAILVEDADDIAYDLFADILHPGTAAEKANLAAAMRDANDLLEQYVEKVGKNTHADVKDVTAEDLADALAAQKTAVSECETVAEVEAIIDSDFTGTGVNAIWNAAKAIQSEKADAALKNVTVTTTEELQAAINAAVSGTTITLKAGTYGDVDFRNGTRDQVNGLTIVGEEGAVVGGIYISVHEKEAPANLTIKNIKFAGGRGVASNNKDVDNLSIINCEFTGTSRICLGNNVITNLLVKDCKFVNCGVGTDTAIYVQKVNGMTVKGCTFDGVAYNAIQVNSEVKGNIIIVDNNFVETTSRVIYLGGLTADSADVTIEGNSFCVPTELKTDGNYIKAGYAIEIGANTFAEDPTDVPGKWFVNVTIAE